MPKSTTSPWCKSTNPEPTSDSQEDSLDDRMVSGNDTTIDRHPYQVKIPEKYLIFPDFYLIEYWNRYNPKLFNSYYLRLT